MKYILFIKETCPYCVKAVDILKEKELDYSVVKFNDTDAQLDLLEEVKTAYDWATVPMVFRKEGNQNEFIGGCDDLFQHLEQE